MRADEEPPVCQTLSVLVSRLPQMEQRESGAGGQRQLRHHAAPWRQRRHSDEQASRASGQLAKITSRAGYLSKRDESVLYAT